MIEKKFLFPEYYILKIPKCDKCNVALKNNNMQLAIYPPKYEYECPECGNIYNFREDEVQGEWKWRTI